MSEDFGLAYESTFDGSMYGTSPVVFAVWFYVISKGYGGQVTLNPKKLAETFGTTVADVEAAIRLHCSPDPYSRTQTDEGRRLRHLGGFSYEVVNHDLYKSARALEEKRAQDRQRQRVSRERRRSTTEVPIFELSQKSVTERDPLLSSPSDLISDPEGVQGEPAKPEPSRFAPADYVATPAQQARCAELGHDVDKLLRRFKKHEFARAYTDWERRFDVWIDDQRTPERPPKRQRSHALGPPWVDETALAFARELGRELPALVREFAKKHHVPPDCLPVADARSEFLKFLAAQAPASAAA